MGVPFGAEPCARFLARLQVEDPNSRLRLGEALWNIEGVDNRGDWLMPVIENSRIDGQLVDVLLVNTEDNT